MNHFPEPRWPSQADITALPSLSLDHFTNSSLTLFYSLPWAWPHAPWGLEQDPWDLPQCLFPALDWGPGDHSGFHVPIHRRGVENITGSWIRLNKNSICQNLSQELYRMGSAGKIRSLLFYFCSIEILGMHRGEPECLPSPLNNVMNPDLKNNSLKWHQIISLLRVTCY